MRPAPVWRIQKSDGTVANLLARWAKDAGWKVHWEGAPDIAITGDSEVGKPDFVSAADFVVSDLKAKGHPIKAKAFADNVLVIKRAEP